MPTNWKKKYEELKEEFDQYKRESIKWSVEDFTGMELDGYSIDEQAAQHALEDMIAHYDCEFGTTWGTVEEYIMQYGEKCDLGFELWRLNN